MIEDVQSTRTTCPYCAVQCSFDIVHDSDTAYEMRTTTDCPVTHGSVCKKGLSALEVVNHAERLTAPLIRKHGQLEPASWDEALAHVANKIERIQRDHGPDAFGVFGGGSLTNEVVYLLAKFARVALKTANIDYNGRFCMSSAAAGSWAVYGLDRGLPFPLEKLKAAQCIVLWGVNLAETLPPVTQFITQARRTGANVIVIDPRLTRTARIGTHHLQVRPGGDLALALAMLNVIVTEGRCNHDFLERRTRGWQGVAAGALPFTPEWAAERTGLGTEQIRWTARLIADAAQLGPVYVLSGRGPEQQSKGVATVKALINLASFVGGLYAPLTGQGNGQGGREHGQKADQLPGYRSIEDPQARAAIARHWGVPEPSLPRTGLSAQELLEACGEKVRGLLVLGSNPVVSAANANLVTRKLESLEHLCVIDFLPSETAQIADVVLPGSMWLESDGTMTNLEGRVLRRKQVFRPPGHARADWRVLCDLAARLGYAEQFAFDSPRAIFEEFTAATRGAPADYSGMTYEKLEPDGLFWPCPKLETGDHPGTPEPFQSRFGHKDGLAHLEPVNCLDRSEVPDLEFPLIITTGRHADHYQSGVQTRRTASLSRKVPHAQLELHHATALEHDLEQGGLVSVSSRRGRITLEVKLSENIRPDTVFVPFHWGGHERANTVTNALLDPSSRMPEFKLAAAKLLRVAQDNTAQETNFLEQVVSHDVLVGATGRSSPHPHAADSRLEITSSND